MWNQRSVDTLLRFTIQYCILWLLLEIIAKEVNMIPDELIGNLGDVHLYSNQIDGVKEQIGRELSLEERKQIFEDRGYVCDLWPFNGDWSGEYDGFGIPKHTTEPYPLPNMIISDKVNFKGTIDDFLDSCSKNSFKLHGYQSHPPIKIPLSN
jgi:thymidylate synthase